MTKASAFRTVDFTQSGWRQINTSSGGSTPIQPTDAFSVVAVSAVGNEHTVQIPSNNFPAGFQTVVARIGTGSVKINTPSPNSVKLNFKAGITGILAAQYSIASIVYSGNSTTGWLIFGDLN